MTIINDSLNKALVGVLAVIFFCIILGTIIYLLYVYVFPQIDIKGLFVRTIKNILIG